MTIAETGNDSSKHILVVDDDADIRAALSDFLEDEGYEVGVVANGLEALAYLRKHPSTSVVLLDLMMPVMDGFQFRAEQKRDPTMSAIPVVVMTAQRPLDPGAIEVDDILSKPLSLTRLLDSIHRAARPSP